MDRNGSAVERYRAVCEAHNVPLFVKPWWLDAVCGQGNWGVSLVERGGVVQAAIPYYYKKNIGINQITMPKLTQTMGPVYFDLSGSYTKKLSKEKDYIYESVGNLPKHDRYMQNIFPEIQNWLPFYWLGFSQTTRYTYRLQLIKTEDRLWNELKSNIKTDIKKAQNRYGLSIIADCCLDEFLELNQKTFERQGRGLPYDKGFVENLDRKCVNNNCRKIFIAKDVEGKAHAGVYLVWDGRVAYYLMGGGDPELRNSGATSLAMWEAIKFAKTVSEIFDFEGSMVEPIERYFRAFGAVQTPYFQITKMNLRAKALYSVYKILRRSK